MILPLEPSLPLMPIVPSLPFKAMPSLPSSPFRPIVPSLPLIEIPSLPFSPLTVIVPGSLSLPMVTSLFKPTCNFALPPSSITLVVTLPSPLTVTVSPSLALTSLPFSSVKPKPLLVILPIVSFKSPTLTALFKVFPVASSKATLFPVASFKPLSTLTIWFPPLFKPLSVTLTVLVLSASFGVTVKPLPLITDLLPVVSSMNVALVKSCSCLAIFRTSLPASLSTRKFLSVTAAFGSNLPKISSSSFSSLAIESPLSPLNFKPSFKVATFSLFTTKRGLVSPSLPFTPAGPSAVLMVTAFSPSLPFKPIEPSLPLIATPEPSLPFTPIWPSTPSLPFSPFWPTVTLSAVRSLARPTTTLPSLVMVLMLVAS